MLRGPTATPNASYLGQVPLCRAWNHLPILPLRSGLFLSAFLPMRCGSWHTHTRGLCDASDRTCKYLYLPAYMYTCVCARSANAHRLSVAELRAHPLAVCCPSREHTEAHLPPRSRWMHTLMQTTWLGCPSPRDSSCSRRMHTCRRLAPLARRRRPAAS